MMDKKTQGMIKYLKHHGSEHITLKDAAIAYMMGYSGAPATAYANGKIDEIVTEIFFDFIDAADKPSVQLRQLKESKESFGGRDQTTAMLATMSLVQVKNDNGYVNGFTAEYEDEETYADVVRAIARSEIEKFRDNVLKCTAEVIYNDTYRINFFNVVANLLLDGDIEHRFSPEVVKWLSTQSEPIERIYDMFMSADCSFDDSWDIITDNIQDWVRLELEGEAAE